MHEMSEKAAQPHRLAPHEEGDENEEVEVEEEPLDPRVQEELERLNCRTEEINQLELQLEDANSLFRTLLSDSTHQVRFNLFNSDDQG